MADPVRPSSRYLAPTAFLLAVVVFVVMLAASGVLSGRGGVSARVTTSTEHQISGNTNRSSTTRSTVRATTTTTRRSTPTTAMHANPTTTTVGQTYTVKPGDSPVSIAERYGVSVVKLMEFNGIKDPMNLQPGVTLRIPPPG